MASSTSQSQHSSSFVGIFEEYRPPPKEGEEVAETTEENFPYPEEYRPKKEGEKEMEIEDEEEVSFIF